MDEKIRFLIESLYCNCAKIQDAKPFNEYLALKSFADSVGGTVYTNERNARILDRLREYSDFLPYGRYQLRFSGVAQEYLEQLFEKSLNKLTDVNAKVKHYCGASKSCEYFICKRCCPICASSQRGCPLHCCTECWKNLSTMSRIKVDKIPIKRIGKLSKKRKIELTNQLDTMILQNVDYKIKLKNKSTGYLHSTYDVIKFIYLTYEYNIDTIKQLIDALSQLA